MIEVRISELQLILYTPVLQKLDNAWSIRELGYKAIRSFVSTQFRINFLNNLQNRNYGGKMLVCHKKETIELKVMLHFLL